MSRVTLAWSGNGSHETQALTGSERGSRDTRAMSGGGSRETRTLIGNVSRDARALIGSRSSSYNIIIIEVCWLQSLGPVYVADDFS